ncbi:MAG: UDP-N-acetylglucosamine 2-epimerase (non-hydrolyzing) [Chloroflexota bacterium]|nr:UDP-N-acetylglucosamine 2-epimerase (non-hydrolyzing) [Chloroflexota bacterium]
MDERQARLLRALLVFGTRPEAVKMARLAQLMRADPRLDPIVCITAQHRQMLDQVLDWFKLTPDIDLNLMQPDQSLADLTARALSAVSRVLADTRPDIVLVQGDTTTVMTAALAAFYARVPVGHIEAGLRTYDNANPFPEEANRRLTSVLAAYHFAPTQRALDTLIGERGIDPARVYLTGNTVVDALHWTRNQPHTLNLDIPFNADEKLILVTAHRRESFGAEFAGMCGALRRIVERNPSVRLVYPVHLNPNVRKPVYEILGGVERVHLIDPLSYPDLVHLMARAWLVLTDSGGIQEEAPSLGKPALVMRRTTERPEAIEAGVAKLVGTDGETILAAVETLLHDEIAYRAMANAVSPFGDGSASERIIDILLREFRQ